MTHPEVDLTDYYWIQSEPGHEMNRTFELKPNIFEANDDKLGMFQSEPEEYSFLTVHKWSELKRLSLDGLPRFFVDFRLADVKVYLERQVYSFFTFIGDAGGFNGAIFMVPTLFIGFYRVRMYEASIYSELPVKKQKKPKVKNTLQKKFEGDDPLR